MSAAVARPALAAHAGQEKKPLPRGVWPVMLTPFDEARGIDWRALDTLIDWYIESGVAGLFSVCLSSEMYELSPAEREKLARRAIARAAGCVPVVVGGMIGGRLEDKAEWAKTVCDHGAAAAVVIVNQLVSEDAGETAWREAMEQLLALTDPLPLGLYECPVPYHRVLSAEVTAWCAATGRLLFMKETSAVRALGCAKIEAAHGTPLSIYNAHTPTVFDTLQSGGDGCSNIAANFYPACFAWLCANYRQDPETAGELNRFLTLADPVVRQAYPFSAKRFLAASGLPVEPVCRQSCAVSTGDDLAALHAALHAEAEIWHTRLGLR